MTTYKLVMSAACEDTHLCDNELQLKNYFRWRQPVIIKVLYWMFDNEHAWTNFFSLSLTEWW